MKVQIPRCPYCQGYFAFSFIDRKGRNVYRCTRCSSVDERLFLVMPLREVEVRRVEGEWECIPPRGRLGYGWLEQDPHDVSV
jgi:hypothetical protein